jgi:hypothetical protein
MADGLTIRKLYVDSRFRSSGTTDDFEMQLEQSIQLGASCHDDDTQLGTDDSGSPRSPVIRIRTIMRTVAMSMAM